MADKVYDLAQLRELAGGSEDFVDSMVDTFLEHTPQQLNDMKMAYQSGDLKAMGGYAHKIKPNIDLFGITALSGDIRQIEAWGKAEQNDAALPALMEKVERILNESFAQMKMR